MSLRNTVLSRHDATIGNALLLFDFIPATKDLAGTRYYSKLLSFESSCKRSKYGMELRKKSVILPRIPTRQLDSPDLLYGANSHKISFSVLCFASESVIQTGVSSERGKFAVQCGPVDSDDGYGYTEPRLRNPRVRA